MGIEVILNPDSDPRECEAHCEIRKDLERAVLEDPGLLQEYIPGFSGKAKILPNILVTNTRTGKKSDTDIVFRDEKTNEIYLLECKSFNGGVEKANIQTGRLSTVLRSKYGVPVHVYIAKKIGKEIDIRHLYSRY